MSAFLLSLKDFGGKLTSYNTVIFIHFNLIAGSPEVSHFLGPSQIDGV
jgi:hypothetical protein